MDSFLHSCLGQYARNRALSRINRSFTKLHILHICSQLPQILGTCLVFLVLFFIRIVNCHRKFYMGELRRLVEETADSYPQGFGQTRVLCTSELKKLLIVNLEKPHHCSYWQKPVLFSICLSFWKVSTCNITEMLKKPGFWGCSLTMRWQQKQTCDTWDDHIPLFWSFSSHPYIWRKEGKSLCSSSAGPICHTVPTALNRFATATHRAPYFYRRLKKCRAFFIICSLSAFSFQLVRMKSSLIWIFLSHSHWVLLQPGRGKHTFGDYLLTNWFHWHLFFSVTAFRRHVGHFDNKWASALLCG